MTRLLALAGFVLAFLATRLANLTALPVFVDEGIHLEWAFGMAGSGRLLGVTGGGCYLPIWVHALVATRSADPLWAARACSATWGLLAALGLYALGRALDDERAGGCAALLYLVIPFTLFYDRMALVESMLAALLAWSLAFGVLWVRTARRCWAIALGLLVGAAGMTKLYGALLMLLPPALLLLRPGADRARQRGQLLWVYGVALLAVLPALIELPAHVAFARQNMWAFRPGPDNSPALLEGLRLALAWQAAYLTPAGSALVGLAVADALRRRDRADGLLLGVWGSWCLFFVMIWGRYWYPRYLLPAVLPLLLLTARCALRAGPLFGWGVVGLFALSSLRTDRALLTDPLGASLPGIERGQYIQEWPAGYGVAEAVEFLKTAAAREGLLLVRDSRNGPLRQGLDLALRRDVGGVETLSVDLRDLGAAAVLGRLRTEMRPVLLALEQPADPQLILDLEGRAVLRPAAVFLKPGMRRQVELYALKGPEAASRSQGDEPLAPYGWPSKPGWHGPGVLADIGVCAGEGGSGSLAACRRVLDRGVGGSVRAEALYHLGRELTVLGRCNEAVKALRDAVRIVPHDLEQQWALAKALEGLGRYEGSLQVLADAVPSARLEHAGLLHQRVGWTLALLGRWDAAEASLRRSLELTPSLAWAHNDLAVCLWIRGRREEARASLLEALRLDGEGLRVRWNDAVMRGAREP